MDATCIRFRTELSAYLDGQLDLKIQAEVEAHLSNCPDCTDELAKMKSLSNFLKEQWANEKPAPMPDLWAGIKAGMPLVCELMAEDMSALLDGELSPAAQEGVDHHLKECGSCLQSFKLLNATNEMLVKGLQLPQQVKVNLWPAVKAQLNEDCALIRRELSAFLDQDVATLRHRNITNHLIECHECRNEFTQLSSVGDIVREAYQPELPEDFDLWPGIKSRLQVVPFTTRVQTTKPRVPKPRMYLTAAVAGMLVVAGSLTFWLSMPNATAGTISSEGYLIESALREPSDAAEAVVYEQ